MFVLSRRPEDLGHIGEEWRGAPVDHIANKSRDKNYFDTPADIAPELLASMGGLGPVVQKSNEHFRGLLGERLDPNVEVNHTILMSRGDGVRSTYHPDAVTPGLFLMAYSVSFGKPGENTQWLPGPFLTPKTRSFEGRDIERAYTWLQHGLILTQAIGRRRWQAPNDHLLAFDLPTIHRPPPFENNPNRVFLRNTVSVGLADLADAA